VEERVWVRRLVGAPVAPSLPVDLLTLTLSSTQTWRRGEQRDLGARRPVFHSRE
jgi:hypothetical protein